MDLAGRVAIVTGGGTGIGRSTCIRLARAGAKAVVVNYSRSVEDAESTAADVQRLGTEAMTHRADIADESMVKAMIAAAVDAYGKLDLLVNNAGTTHFIPFADLDALTDKVWDDILSVNLKGTFFCCRASPSKRDSEIRFSSTTCIAAAFSPIISMKRLRSFSLTHGSLSRLCAP